MTDVRLTTVPFLFQSGGLLSQKIVNFEFRPEQKKMAEYVMQALQKGEFLLVEAGTGTGKTWAYLVPAILWAKENNKRVIISTYTKNLQSQLFESDLPALLQALKLNLSVAFLKGKENYLCLLRLQRKTEEQLALSGLEQSGDAQLIQLLLTWSRETDTGDLNECDSSDFISHPLRRAVNVENHFCLNQDCIFFSRCFYFKARQQAQEAQLVVVNHFLFFSDIATGHSLLGEYDAVIFDEAQNVEEVAARYFGAELDFWSIKQITDRLWSERPTPSGLLKMLSIHIAPAVNSPRQKNWWKRELSKTQGKITFVNSVASGFFQQIADSVPVEEGKALFSTRVRFYKESQWLTSVAGQGKELLSASKQLSESLGRLAKALSEVDIESVPRAFEFIAELETRGTELRQVESLVADFLSARDEKEVYWVELSPRNSLSVTFHRQPLEVKEQLKTQLYDRIYSVIFSSATLTVDRDFEYIKDQLGLTLTEKERIVAHQVGTSFKFAQQVKAIVPVFVGSPLEPGYLDRVAELLTETVRRFRLKTLALFTAYSHLGEVYKRLQENLRTSPTTVLGQLIDGTPEQVLERFRQAERVILLGVAALWEGIDLPGKELELLFICRLPFAVPTDPVTSARIEQLEKKGLEPFANFSLPDAVLKFKQGFGRLIRTQHDQGIFVILDNRVVKKSYGRFFVEALPVDLEISADRASFLEIVSSWFKKVDIAAT